MSNGQISKDAIAGLILIGIGVAVVVLLSIAGPRNLAGYKFTRIETDDISPGEHKLVDFQGTPVVLYKQRSGNIHSFVGKSPLSGCQLDYISSSGLGPRWNGGWVDRCAIGAWDEEGKFLDSGIFGNDPVLSDLPKPNMLSWDGSVAVFHP